MFLYAIRRSISFSNCSLIVYRYSWLVYWVVFYNHEWVSFTKCIFCFLKLSFFPILNVINYIVWMNKPAILLFLPSWRLNVVWDINFLVTGYRFNWIPTDFLIEIEKLKFIWTFKGPRIAHNLEEDDLHCLISSLTTEAQ